MKYSDLFCKFLKEDGYTHCFVVTGGNIMHLIGSANEYFKIIPVVNEVAAGIAAEYFNEIQNKQKAFVLVTAGPGLTNITTAAAGAYLESRELLIIGGQVKVSDLSRSNLRQKGIQEIDGVKIMESISKISVRIEEPIAKNELSSIINFGRKARKGPVFIEVPLDVQAKNINEIEFKNTNHLKLNIDNSEIVKIRENELIQIVDKIYKSKRPVILIGGGVDRDIANEIAKYFDNISIPIMTTWNAADRIGYDCNIYFGRPNNWGQRYANIILQQSDCLLAIGTRLGIQQTGFNWQEFVPNGDIIQIDCDQNELEKGHPKINMSFCVEANDFIRRFLSKELGNHNEWLEDCKYIKSVLPLNEKNSNSNSDQYISPYSFVEILSNIANKNDIIIPCSSGGAFTVMMQCFYQKNGQKIVTNKALASMGYGLSGAIGAAIANYNQKTILVEGDGGFAQNLQEIATAVANNLNLKIFLFENSGYASIRMTQKNYFNGQYIGCDTKTGLGFPDWIRLFDSYGVDSVVISNENFIYDKKFNDLFNNKKCAAFIVKIDPEQTYFPKISSRVKSDGGMESNPLHLMSPDLDLELAKQVFKYIEYEK